MTNIPILTLLIFFPFIGSLVILLINKKDESYERKIKEIGLWTSIITFFLSLILFHSFDKTETQLKEIVAKNLEKNSLYYIEKGQFGETDLGYTADAPGLKPTEIKGKYISSGYGDSSTKQSDTAPQELKEGHIKLTNLLSSRWSTDNL